LPQFLKIIFYFKHPVRLRGPAHVDDDLQPRTILV